ncbi:MAG: cell division protein FtsQ/DivIB [Acidiferrobacter sp.]
MNTRADLLMRSAGRKPKPKLRFMGLRARFPKRYAVVAGLILGALLLTLCARAFLAPGRFPVRVVRLVGDLQSVPRPLLVAAIAPYLRQNFYAVDLDAVGNAVSQVPWVGTAHVERRFPRTLIVYVSRLKLAAKWGLGGWVNRAGEHVHLQGYHPPQGLPVFQGPSGQEADMVAQYGRFQAMLDPLGLTIVALTLSARHTWRISVNRGPVLVLGHDAGAHLQRFVDVYSQIATSLAAMQRVDLRYTNGFAVSWRKTSGEQHDKKG